MTPPERELLAALGLDTVAALRRRMDERALLAAYDGAPAALTEVLVERVPERSKAEIAPNREQTCAATDSAELWETTLAFNPEALRVRIRFSVGRQRPENNVVDPPPEPPERRFYAVSLRIRDGRVLLRESGKIEAVPGMALVEHDVVREFVAQDFR